jgi:bifunctional DNase/RNase
MFLKMKVFGLTIDPFTNVPIVILKDDGEKNALPVWIGVLEASAIASELEKVQFTRPMTHDLLKDLLKQVGVKVEKIEVTDLKDNVYYATIHMTGGNGAFTMDSRPSDAIALALRTGAPIYVESGVLEKSKHMDLKGEPREKGPNEEPSLEDFTPGDYGKYKM